MNAGSPPKFKRSRGTRDTLHAFTERAKLAVDLAQTIPPMVYLPRELRAHKTFITEDDLKVSINPPDIAGNHIRMAKADPLGFLIAVMNGQPIPEFIVMDRTPTADNPNPDPAIAVEYHVPNMTMRLECAQWLANRLTYRPFQSGSTRLRNTGHGHEMNKQFDDYEALIKQRLAAESPEKEE